MNLPSILFVLLTAGRLAVGTGLNCSAGTSRFGKSMRRVQPPLSCQGSPNMPSPTWCDEPGRDYPWQEIQEYLRRSSAAASKRAALPDASGMKRLLAKYRPGKSRAPGRRTRSTSDVYDVSGHRSPTRVARLASRSRNWEFSDDRPDATERLETAAPAVGDTANFGSPGAAQEGDRDDESETFLENVDYKGGFTEEEELAILFSYFTEPSGIVVTKGVLEDIIKLGEALDNALGWRQPATEAPPDDGPASVETSAASAQGASGEAAPQEHQPVGEAPLFHDGGAPKVSAPAQESVAVTEQPRLETLDAMPENSTDSPAAAHTTGPTAPPEPTTTLPPPAAAPTPSPSPPVAAQPAVDAPAPVTATASTSVFSEAERRSPPGPSQIRAEVRTGEDVLAEITAGEEILADALAAELEDWPREEPSAEDWRQEEQEDWTREEPSAEDWRQEEQEDWTREDRPPEVQYYLPPARSTVAPPAAEPAEPAAAQWTAPAASDWLPLPSPPHADPLVARPPALATPVEPARTTAGPAPGAHSQAGVATETPAAGETTVDLLLEGVMETVYTDVIYRPEQEAVFTRPAAATTTARTTTTTTPASPPAETTPDPYTTSACRASVEIRSPFYAMNTQHIWKMLINMPPFETYIHMEHCVEKFEQGRCAAGCRCTQRYTVRTMPVYERDANDCDLIYMDKFLFPSHCDCMCLPTPYVLFNITRPPATSPTPNDVPPSSTFAPPRTDGASVTPMPVMSSDGEANSTLPETITDVDRIEALKASLSGARVVTAAPTSPPSSRRAPGSRHPPTVPSRRPIVPAEALVTTHRNRNRGPPPFGPPYPPLRRYSSRPYSPGSAPRRDGRADQMPPALPR